MAIDNLLDLEETGMTGSIKGQKIYLYGPNDVGKAIPNDTLIPTPSGKREVGEIKVGDFLIGKNGKPVKVLKVYPQGEKEVWEIKFKDGRTAKCCNEHLWSIISSRGNLITKSTKELFEMNYKGRSIPLCNPVDYEDKNFIVPPYVAGSLIGNGSFRGKYLEYSSKNDSVPEYIAQLMGWSFKKSSEYNYTYVFYNENGTKITTEYFLKTELNELIGKYSYEKTIPAIYMLGSAEQRFELLNGLMDTDGSFGLRGGIVFSTTSHILKDDMIELCRSLGMKATATEDKRKHKYKSGECFSVNICTPLSLKGKIFTLKEHKQRYEKWLANSKKLNNNDSLSIVEIYPLNYKTEMTCFVVDSDDHLFLMNDYIVTHNTFQSMKLPKPLLLMTEAGGNGVKGFKKPVNKWAKFKNYVAQLTSEKMVDDPNNKDNKIPTYELMQQKFETIVIDTVENLVELAEQATCQEFGVRDLSEISGRQNGYSIYRKDFKTQVNNLCSYGYTVVFIGHEEKVEIEDEITGEKYTFVQPKGSNNEKASTRFVRDLCDFCMYLKPNGIDANGDTIPSTAICKQTKHAFARSRYAIQTFINPFSADNLVDAIVKAIERSAENEGANLSDWKITHDDYTRDDWVSLIEPYYKAVYSRYPDKAKGIVSSELGEGGKVSKATNENLVELENIYNKLVTAACDAGIVVE